MLRNVHLHGRLANMYSSKAHSFDANTPFTVISALNSIYPGFKNLFFKGERIAFLLKKGTEIWTISDTGGMPIHNPLGDATDLHLMLVEEGAGIETAIVAGWLSAAAGTTIAATSAVAIIATIALNAAIGLAISAIAASLADKPSSSQGGTEQRSYLFEGPVNLSAMGHPVPLIYGRFQCGSVVIGADVTVEQQGISVDNQTTAYHGTTETGNLLDNDIRGDLFSITGWTIAGTAKTVGTAYSIGSLTSTLKLNADGSFEVIVDSAETESYKVSATYTASASGTEQVSSWEIDIVAINSTNYISPGGGDGTGSTGGVGDGGGGGTSADGDGTAGDG